MLLWSSYQVTDKVESGGWLVVGWLGSRLNSAEDDDTSTKARCDCVERSRSEQKREAGAGRSGKWEVGSWKVGKAVHPEHQDRSLFTTPKSISTIQCDCFEIQ
ncbi:hypothetical protein ACMFMG_009939 [Clarireedia jacksonii]